MALPGVTLTLNQKHSEKVLFKTVELSASLLELEQETVLLSNPELRMRMKKGRFVNSRRLCLDLRKAGQRLRVSL